MAYKLPTTWSSQQADFIDWAVKGTGSCVLRAVAGSGKTTTFLGAVARMRGPIAILAYNKKIAEEIKQKLIDLGIDWKTANAGTVHSFGFGALRKTFGNIEVDEKKIYNLIEALRPRYEFASIVQKLVSLAKQRALGAAGSRISDKSLWLDIVDHFDMADEDFEGAAVDEAIELAQDVLVRSNKNTRVIDFDDMVYLPLIHPVKFFQYQVIIVDEAQDTNPARRLLVGKMLVRGGRLIAVGDDRQAIYGFTGADSDSLDLIAKEFNAKFMPLTVTYRCPKAVAKFAHQWVDHIQAHDSAPEGTVGQATADDNFVPEAQDAILCRNTKPLVSLAFNFIRRRIACKIEGRDIGNGLIKLANKWKSCKTIDAFENRLDAYFSKQSKKLEGVRLQTLMDQVETTRAIMGFCRDTKKYQMTDVVAWVEELFADNVKGVVTLSTIHKSKGREWNTVFWLNRAQTCPSRYATLPWMQKQEANLCYVAATRAMKRLIELDGPSL